MAWKAGLGNPQPPASAASAPPRQQASAGSRWGSSARPNNAPGGPGMAAQRTPGGWGIGDRARTAAKPAVSSAFGDDSSDDEEPVTTAQKKQRSIWKPGS